MANSRPTPVVSKKKAGEVTLSGKDMAALAREVLEKGRAFRFQAKGTSMAPFICDGDIVLLESFGEKSPEKGDVIAVFVSNREGLLVHRIIEKDEEGFVIKGDNLVDPDGTVARTEIIGRVASVEKGERTVRCGKRTGSTIIWSRILNIAEAFRLWIKRKK